MSYPLHLAHADYDPALGRWPVLSYSGSKSTILVGASGIGKFIRSIARTLLTYPGSCIVLDPKGEAAAVTARYRARIGKVVVFNPFNELAFIPWLRSDNFNPVAALDPASPNFSRDTAAIGNAAIMQSRGDNAYFTSGSRRVTVGLTEFMRCCNPRYGLVEVHDALHLGPEDWRGLMRHLAESPSPNARDLAALFGHDKLPKSLEEQLNDARTQLSEFLSVQPIRTFLSGASDFVWPDLKREVITVYIVMPGRDAKDFARLTRLILSSAMGALLAPPRGEVLFIMDELATALGDQELSIIETGFNQGRGFGLRCQAVLQSWAQAKDIWGERTEAVASGAGVMQWMRPNDPVSAKRIADRAGMRDARIVTFSESGGVSTTERGSSESSGWSVNAARQSVPLLRPEDLYGMPDDRQVIYVEGQSRPIFAWGVDYFNPMAGLQGRYDPNPYAPGYVPPSLSDVPVQRIQAR